MNLSAHYEKGVQAALEKLGFMYAPVGPDKLMENEIMEFNHDLLQRAIDRNRHIRHFESLTSAELPTIPDWREQSGNF